MAIYNKKAQEGKAPAAPRTGIGYQYQEGTQAQEGKAPAAPRTGIGYLYQERAVVRQINNTRTVIFSRD